MRAARLPAHYQELIAYFGGPSSTILSRMGKPDPRDSEGFKVEPAKLHQFKEDLNALPCVLSVSSEWSEMRSGRKSVSISTISASQCGGPAWSILGTWSSKMVAVLLWTLIYYYKLGLEVSKKPCSWKRTSFSKFLGKLGTCCCGWNWLLLGAASPVLLKPQILKYLKSNKPKIQPEEFLVNVPQHLWLPFCSVLTLSDSHPFKGRRKGKVGGALSSSNEVASCCWTCSGKAP